MFIVGIRMGIWLSEFPCFLFSLFFFCLFYPEGWVGGWEVDLGVSRADNLGVQGIELCVMLLFWLQLL